MRNKVIGSFMSGRLGNQMFQYAFAKALKMAQGGTGQFVFNFKRVYHAGTIDEGFEDSLKYFNVEPYEMESANLILKYGNIFQIIVYLLFVAIIRTIHLYSNDYKGEFLLSILRRTGILYSSYSDNRYCVYDKYFNNKLLKKKYICSGKFENPTFFNKIRPILLEEFTPKISPLKENYELYQMMDQTNSVCVSIRRGDYLNNNNRKNFYICDEVFFRKAIGVVKCKIDNPVLFFFSDDINWVKGNIQPDLPSFYESGKDPVWEKLRLMYSCKHFIISNSTFSWWAQYLSRNDNKIVISPDHWFNHESKVCSCQLLLDNFVKIPC